MTCETWSLHCLWGACALQEQAEGQVVWSSKWEGPSACEALLPLSLPSPALPSVQPLVWPGLTGRNLQVATAQFSPSTCKVLGRALEVWHSKCLTRTSGWVPSCVQACESRWEWKGMRQEQYSTGGDMSTHITPRWWWELLGSVRETSCKTVVLTPVLKRVFHEIE